MLAHEPMTYYNDKDPKACEWLRELIRVGLIADGVVDCRSISEIKPDELKQYTQCHFFAGIGGWSIALRLAGWPDSRRVWTASCPCQPFSVGATDQAKGTGDHRDLWPSLLPLIKINEPSTIFGEQVKNAISWGWWDRAKMDFENEGYAAAAAVLRADAIGAIHERKRLYWVADSERQGREGREPCTGVSVRKEQAYAIYGDPITKSRRAVDGDWADLQCGDGFSVQVVRDAIKGYGNAIVPQIAAEFIGAYIECAVITRERSESGSSPC